MQVLADDDWLAAEAIEKERLDALSTISPWYAFGFFRWMGYAFFCLHVFAILATIYSGYSQDWYGMSMNVVLIVSSFVAGVCAYCHEGLSSEVMVFSKQNHEFAARNDVLRGQLKDMEGVEQKYNSILDDLQGDAPLLKELAESLHKVALMNNLQILFQAFRKAAAGGDRVVGAAKVDLFFTETWEVLQHASGDSGQFGASEHAWCFPLKLLYDAALSAKADVSFDKHDLKLLVYACSISGDPSRPQATHALLWLILFSFSPEVHAHRFTQSVIVALTGTNAAEEDMQRIRRLIFDITCRHPGAFKYSRDKDCTEFVYRILNYRQKMEVVHGFGRASLRPTPRPTQRGTR